jgi:hypothetical protein
MCGPERLVDFESKTDSSAFSKMMDIMAVQRLDAKNIYYEKTKGLATRAGARRISIIDITPSCSNLKSIAANG